MSKIDLNQADVETLAQLKGIGDKLAARIVTYRETVHPFEETIELAAVPGISERMVRALADEIAVVGSSAGEEAAGPELAVAGLSPEAPGTEIAAPMLSPAVMETVQREEGEETTAPAEPVSEEAEVVVLAETGAEEEDRAEKERPTWPEEVSSTPTGAATVPEGGLPPAAPAIEQPPPAEEPEETGLREEELPAPPAAGPSFVGYLLTAFFGALLGAGLTLLLLYALNGTLDFASPAQVARVQNQVVTQGEAQSGLSEEVMALSTEQSRAVAAGATTAARQEEAAGELASLEQELAGLEQEVSDDVEALEADTAVLATRVSGLSDAAENFDLFLDGMRDLLIELRGLPPTPTATPTITTTATITATAAAEEITPTPTVTSTPTPVVTRTPRPTATPFVNPTATAVNSP